jgi:hypothetical protein
MKQRQLRANTEKQNTYKFEKSGKKEQEGEKGT